MLVDIKVYTLIHVVVSLIGIVSGLVVVGALAAGNRSPRLASVFLHSTLVTTVTGFGFPFSAITPAHVVGVVSLLTLAGAYFSLYGQKLQGPWSRVFVVLAVTSLYFNVFVLVAQLLQKIPALAALAPAPTAPAFALTQGLVLVIFVLLGRAALMGSTGRSAA